MLEGLESAAAAGSAAGLRGALLALFDAAQARPDRLQWVQACTAAGLPAGGDATLARAAGAVAAAIDAEAERHDRNAYHNRQHYCEVALTAYALARLQRLPAPATQWLLLAALLHDAVHAGRPQTPFSQERASVASMRPLLRAAGLTEAGIERLMALVLATETRGGTAWTAAVARGQAHEPPPAPELAALSADPALALLARLLCEADVLPSLGLGTAHAKRLQRRLAAEWGRPLDVPDKLAFIDGVLQQGYLGATFLPEVQALRASLADELHEGAPG